MRFELSVAFKYLLPKARQLSVTIISLVSILVISLVVWLVIVFLSVTNGIEKKWLEELVTINAPLRVSPTEEYYNSYYYAIDALSETSGYTSKSLGEKLKSPISDPYDISLDAELPSHFPKPDKNPDGSLKDLAKLARDAIQTLPVKGVRPGEYEVSFGNLDLNLLRKKNGEMTKSFLTQLCYISSFDKENKALAKLILPLSDADVQHVEKEMLFTDGVLPKTALKGQGILISKTFLQNGVLVGDSGYITYYAPTNGTMKEQRLKVFVAGFYDPGLMPVGGKVIFADPTLLANIRSDLRVTDNMLGNGFQIFLADTYQAPIAKIALQQLLKERGIDRYFEVKSYDDYEFAKPVLEQLKSDKTLFTLISIIILIVACSNIISMLILLVNDKKKEIGILQSMGVTTRQIATIFGLCGFLTGAISSLIGISAAILTLKNLQGLVNFLSFLQGREAFQAAFYGSGLPNELSQGTALLVLIATILISLLAGIVPAIKAAMIRPAVILRSE